MAVKWAAQMAEKKAVGLADTTVVNSVVLSVDWLAVYSVVRLVVMRAPKRAACLAA